MHYCLSKFCQQIIYGKSRIITLSVVSTLEFQGTRPLLCSQQLLNTSSSDGLQVKIVEFNLKSEIQVNSCSIINLKIARKRDGFVLINDALTLFGMVMSGCNHGAW